MAEGDTAKKTLTERLPSMLGRIAGIVVCLVTAPFLRSCSEGDGSSEMGLGAAADWAIVRGHATMVNVPSSATLAENGLVVLGATLLVGLVLAAAAELLEAGFPLAFGLGAAWVYCALASFVPMPFWFLFVATGEQPRLAFWGIAAVMTLLAWTAVRSREKRPGRSP